MPPSPSGSPTYQWNPGQAAYILSTPSPPPPSMQGGRGPAPERTPGQAADLLPAARGRGGVPDGESPAGQIACSCSPLPPVLVRGRALDGVSAASVQPQMPLLRMFPLSHLPPPTHPVLHLTRKSLSLGDALLILLADPLLLLPLHADPRTASGKPLLLSGPPLGGRGGGGGGRHWPCQQEGPPPPRACLMDAAGACCCSANQVRERAWSCLLPCAYGRWASITLLVTHPPSETSHLLL